MRSFPVLLQTLRHTGFRVRERMDGVHEFAAREGPAGEFPFSLHLGWGPERFFDFLNPMARDTFLTAESRGVIRAGGLVEEADCQGTLEFRYVPEAKIRYRLYFSVGKSDYEYIGEKTGLRPWNLVRTHTTCYGVLYELGSGKEISRSLLRFRLSTLPSMIHSFTVTGPESNT
jgi:hypothetical protein